MNAENKITALHIGTVVRRYSDSPRTRELGVVKSVHAGSSMNPGWHYTIAWTGRGIERAVSESEITSAS